METNPHLVTNIRTLPERPARPPKWKPTPGRRRPSRNGRWDCSRARWKPNLAELVAEDIDAVGGRNPGNAENDSLRQFGAVVPDQEADRHRRHGSRRQAAPHRVRRCDEQFALIERTLGSHNYQHIAVDPRAGDIYL
jgi:hypothetical protein